jgi:hypothetical protein
VAGIVRSGVRLRVLAGAIVLLILGLAFAQDLASLARGGALPAVLGLTSPEEYLDHNLGWYSQGGRPLHDLPPGPRGLLLWEPRGYYAPPTAQADPWIDRWRVDRAELGSPQDILASWRSQGFTHVFIYQAGVEDLREFDRSVTTTDWAALDQLLASLPEPTLFGTAYALYPLR